MEDLTGQRFGRWTVTRLSHRTKYRDIYWLCRCDCDNENAVRTSHLTKGLSQSCGCLQRELAAIQKFKHGMSYHPLYKTWSQMKQRCSNLRNDEYQNYGGRGIYVCQHWQDSFATFYEDMGEPPPNTTLDRIDNDGPYSAENCRWASPTIQRLNSRNVRWITFGGETRTLKQWATHLGIVPATLSSRINQYGWSIEDAFTRPIDTRCHHRS